MSVRLEDCPTVFDIHLLAQVLGRSVRTIEREERNGTFPIPRLKLTTDKTRKHFPRKYAKVAVARWIEREQRR